MIRVRVVMLLVVCSTAGHAFAQATAEEQFDLADRYLAGDGVPKDAVVAVEWYRKAAEQGHVAAQLVLGMMYAKGERSSGWDIDTANRLIQTPRQSGVPIAHPCAMGWKSGVPIAHPCAMRGPHRALCGGVQVGWKSGRPKHRRVSLRPRNSNTE